MRPWENVTTHKVHTIVHVSMDMMEMVKQHVMMLMSAIKLIITPTTVIRTQTVQTQLVVITVHVKRDMSETELNVLVCRFLNPCHYTAQRKFLRTVPEA